MASKFRCGGFAALCASLCAIAPVQAAQAETPRMTTVADNDGAGQRFSVSVAFADLDLLGDAGVRTLRDRVRLAAKLACGASDASSIYYDIRRGFKRCFAQSLGQASNDIDLAVASARSSGRLATGRLSIRVVRR